jgi:hypothetical protein
LEFSKKRKGRGNLSNGQTGICTLIPRFKRAVLFC